MKTAKFIIMLQALFLIGVFVFSASAVHQPGQVGPSAITNLALRQEGYEPALPEHDTYQTRLSNLDSIARAAEALQAGQVPENAEVLNIPGADSPVYLVSFLDKTDKRQFLVVMARSDESKAIEGVIEKNEQLSDQLGIFVGLSPTQSIEDIIAGMQKTSSGGVSSEKLIKIMKELSSEDFYVRRNAVREAIKIAPAMYPALDKLIMLLEDEYPAIRKYAAYTIGSIALGVGSDAVIPQLNRRSETANDELAEVIRGILNRIGANPIEDYLKTSSAGIVTEELSILIDQLEDYEKTGYPHLLQDTLQVLSDMGPVAYPVLKDLAQLFENEKDPILKKSIMETIMTIENIDPKDRILGNIELLTKTSSGGINSTDRLALRSKLRMAERAQDYAEETLAYAKASGVRLEEAESAYDEAVAKVDMLKDIIAAEKTSSAGMDLTRIFALQIEEVKSELESTEFELEVVQADLARAKLTQNNANKAILEAAKADKQDEEILQVSSEFNLQSNLEEADAEVMELTDLANILEQNSINLQNRIERLNTLAASKTSSAGTIVLDDINMPDSQKQLLNRFLGSEGMTNLTTQLGYYIKLSSQLDSMDLKEKLNEPEKVVFVENEQSADSYAAAASLIETIKGLLADITEQPQLDIAEYVESSVSDSIAKSLPPIEGPDYYNERFELLQSEASNIANQLKISLGNKVKASSAGISKAHQKVLDIFRDLKPYAIKNKKNLMTFNKLLTGFSEVEAKYAKEKAALFTDDDTTIKEIEHNLQYAKDARGTINSSLDYSSIQEMDKEQVILLYDKNTFPEDQFEIARKKHIALLKTQQVRMNCKTMRVDANNLPKGLKLDSCVAFTSNPELFRNAGVKRCMEVTGAKVKTDRYLQFTDWAVFAKSMRMLEDNPHDGALRSIASRAYKRLTGEPLSTEMLEGYIKNPAKFIITIVLPVMDIVYEEGELENLYMQAKLVLEAA